LFSPNTCQTSPTFTSTGTIGSVPSSGFAFQKQGRSFALLQRPTWVWKTQGGQYTEAARFHAGTRRFYYINVEFFH
jgi:hypothetical protein